MNECLPYGASAEHICNRKLVLFEVSQVQMVKTTISAGTSMRDYSKPGLIMDREWVGDTSVYTASPGTNMLDCVNLGISLKTLTRVINMSSTPQGVYPGHSLL
jgi:hypothetical protein